MVWKTTNGGLNWGYQQPDIGFQIGIYGLIYFIDSLTGWAYNVNGNKGIQTTNGGGPIIFTSISQLSSEIPKDYKLLQNYPNPFNSSTKIKFQISASGHVVLKVMDILGKELSVQVNQKLSAGTYESDFKAGNISSGVFMYQLIVDGNVIETKKMILIK